MKLKMKNMPLYPWFFIALQILVRRNLIFGCFKYKSRTTSKGPFAASQFPAPANLEMCYTANWRKMAGRCFPQGHFRSWLWQGTPEEERLKGRCKDRRIEALQAKGRSNEKKENDRK